MRSHALPIAGLLLAISSMALVACTPTAAVTPNVSPSQPDPSASASSDPDALDDGVLFRITATVQVPSGATAELVETVSAPRSPTTAENAELEANYCPLQEFAPLAVQDAQLEATVTSGTWPSGPSQILVSAGDWSVFAGDVTAYQAFCAPLLLTVPGSASALTVFTDGPADEPGGWANQQYGFGVDTAWKAFGGDPSPDLPMFTSCRIELSSEATSSSAIAAGWANAVQDIPAETCSFGEFS